MPKKGAKSLGKDLISKSIFKRLLQDMASSLLHLELAEVELLETSRQRVKQRHADLVAKVIETNGQHYILHIEIQNDNDPSMVKRMLRYNIDIREDFPDLPISQYLVYIGKNQFNMPTRLQDIGLDYNYKVLDTRKTDCEQLLDSNNPDALVLAILCDFGERPPKDVIGRILLGLQSIYRDDLSSLRDRVLMLEVLATNRNLLPVLKESENEMLTVDIKQLPSYQIGWEQGEITGLSKGKAEGKAEGEAKLIRALLRKQSPQQVADLTGISLSKIVAIAAHADNNS